MTTEWMYHFLSMPHEIIGAIAELLPIADAFSLVYTRREIHDAIHQRTTTRLRIKEVRWKSALMTTKRGWDGYLMKIADSISYSLLSHCLKFSIRQPEFKHHTLLRNFGKNAKYNTNLFVISALFCRTAENAPLLHRCMIYLIRIWFGARCPEYNRKKFYQDDRNFNMQQTIFNKLVDTGLHHSLTECSYIKNALSIPTGIIPRTLLKLGVPDYFWSGKSPLYSFDNVDVDTYPGLYSPEGYTPSSQYARLNYMIVTNVGCEYIKDYVASFVTESKQIKK